LIRQSEPLDLDFSPDFITKENEKAGEKLSIKQLVKQRINNGRGE